MNNFQIKLFALIFMTFDHVAFILLNQGTELYTILRILGRLSFPLFAFLLIQGHIHTRNQSKYFYRLALFALILDIPRVVLHIPYPTNIFYTLAISEFLLIKIDSCENQYIKVAYIILSCAIANLLQVDYGIYGVLLILLTYKIWTLKVKKKEKIKTYVLSYVILTILFVILVGYPVYQLFGAVAIVFIANYNNELGKYNKVVKYGFYIYYPLHLVILTTIYLFM